MKQSFLDKLNSMQDHYEELALLLSDPAVIADQNRFTAFSKEYAQLEPIINCYQAYQAALTTADNATVLLQEEDAELRQLAADELQQAKEQQEQLEKQLKILLLPKDPGDERNVYLEIRAGTGGDEAALFAGDLFRMYARFAERKGWQLEVMSEHLGEHGGFKEIIAKISGQQVYAELKFESGAHRVQRVPQTESQGRIHTSACTVAVLPEAKMIDEVTINTDEVRVDTYRASGAGGQHVNKTDSAVRLTHLPSGIVVECQDERSQHKNRAKAYALLQAKILSAQQAKQQQEQAQTRRLLVGSGDRSERIRTYNYPQGRVTDHRINLTLYKLTAIMEGALAQVIDPLRHEYQADLLAEFDEQ